MANCRSYAENLSCAASNRSWSGNLVYFPSVNWKGDEKVPNAQSEKIEVKSGKFSVRYEER